jgi:hypothetical protein
MKRSILSAAIALCSISAPYSTADTDKEHRGNTREPTRT